MRERRDSQLNGGGADTSIHVGEDGGGYKQGPTVEGLGLPTLKTVG